jgi:DHA1 family inner membrane transport protein
MLFLASAFGFGFSTPIQVRVLHGAREAPRLAATLVSSAYNVGIAGGAAVGAALLTAGVSYALLPVTGLVCSSIALGLATISITLSRRGIA